MKKYEYENATVYITIPTEKHLQNIRNATEVFARKIMKEGIDIYGRDIDGNRSIRKVSNRKRKRIAKTTRNN